MASRRSLRASSPSIGKLVRDLTQCPHPLALVAVGCGVIALGISSAEVAAGHAGLVDRQSTVATVSASVDVVSGKPEVVVHITNNHPVALEAWQLRLVVQGDADIPQTIDITTDAYAGAARPGPGRGPIQPGETRHLTFAVPSIARTASATLLMALRQDLSAEGSSAAVAAVLTKRERDAETLTIWLEALASVKGRGPNDVRAGLGRVLAAEKKRLGEETPDATALGLYRRFAGLLASSDPADISQERLAQLEARLETELRLAMRHKQNR